MDDASDIFEERSSSKIVKEMKNEQIRINKLNNGFASQKEISSAAQNYQSELHQKKFSIPVVKNKLAPAFLPPINRESLENLKQKADLIKIESESNL